MISFHDKQVLTVSRWKSSIPLRREGTWPYFEAGSSDWFKNCVKENKNDLLEITKDLLQQSFRSWFELATRVAADEPGRSN